MMSKAPRWNDVPVNTKIKKPALKKSVKEAAASSTPACDGNKQVASEATKSSVSTGRSSSFGSRAGDLKVAATKVGGSLKGGFIGHQAAGQASHRSKPALRLSSSRSFSSLHSSSLTAATFIRSSRSLSRLDQRATAEDSDNASQTSQVKKIGASGRRIMHYGRRSSSLDKVRDEKGQSHGDDPDKMKTSSSPQPLSQSDMCSSLVSATPCHHHNEKNLTRDGVHMLCAMTSGKRHNWVQAVLKNVRPGLAHDATGPEQSREQPQDSQPGDMNSDATPQCHQQEIEGERSQHSPDEGSVSLSLPFSPSASSVPSSADNIDEGEESDGRPQGPPSGGVTQTVLTDASPHIDSSTSTMMSLNDECLDEDSNVQTSKDEKIPVNEICSCTKYEETVAQLVKEMEKTQRELCQLQKENSILQDELQQQRERHSKQQLLLQNDTNTSSGPTLTFQHVQKLNHDLRCELDALKRSQEEAREAELRRRVDLLAQQAQLLVTGDATALAQAHIEQDRRRFQEQQVEWEQCLASLKSQLNLSEEQRREAESRSMQLRQELQSHLSLQREAEQLRKHLEDVSTQFHAYERAQVEKEGRLQKHLTLLQESQERERRSLASSLTQAQQHSQELQERLERAEQQVESLHKSRALTKEIEEAQRQLQEELARTVSAVQRLQEERDQLGRHCQELQNQLSEADRELNTVQGRLQTDETQYYNLEHSYETVCEQLQVALGRVEQKESDIQEIREGYERLLDRKEQELSEVLLKMEVLGNSLEETEVKLNEALKSCTCANAGEKDESSELQKTPEVISGSRSKMATGSDVTGLIQDDGNEQVMTASQSLDASHQYVVGAGYDPERFMSVIQSLETKLFFTEEKLRDITQRLEEHQTHTGCQDPRLCSQLTQSRATAQHLSLLLHSQAKRSRHFAQETENCCRMLVGRFQAALNIVQVCRERLHATPLNLFDVERQLAGVATCLQQGEMDAEKQQRDSRDVVKSDSKMLIDEKFTGGQSDACQKSEIPEAPPSPGDEGSVEKHLMRELSVVEIMASALQSPHVISQLSSPSGDDKGAVADRYKNIISQRIALQAEKMAASANSEPLEIQIGQILAEAEVIYAAIKFQLQRESAARAGGEDKEHQRAGLADINPPELAPYEEQVQVDTKSGVESTAAMEEDKKDEKREETEELPWLGRLTSRLQRRAEFLREVCEETSDENTPVSEYSSEDSASVARSNCIQEQVKMIYLSDRIYVDLEKELQQDEVLQREVQVLCQEKDLDLVDKDEALNGTFCRLQEDNNLLREGLERGEQKMLSIETENRRLLEQIEKNENRHEEETQNLEKKFQDKLKQLQQIHEEEMKNLHDFYIKSKDKQTKPPPSSPPNQSEVQKNTQEENETQITGGGGEATREAHNNDLEKLKESCQQEFGALEEMHRKQIGDLHQQHQKEMAELLKQKDQLLQEETAATMAAIVAMRRAHKHELEKSRRSQRIRESADITQLCAEYEGEIQSLQKELQALSVQHTEKCLENSQLSQELQERDSVSQYRKENQELKNHQTDEPSQLQFSLNGHQMRVVPQGNDFYEMEVILRAREAEMQFLRQEAQSLREELKITRMDKIYAQNKLKALCTNNQDEDLQHVNTLREDFPLAAWPPSKEPAGHRPEDSVTRNPNPALPKKIGKSSLMRQIRGVRSKSLKEGLSVQERLKLFESS